MAFALAWPGPAGEKVVWKPVEFAIVRYNDDAPASWNMYHGEKKGLLLLRLWRRYLLVNVQEQEVYELDPDKVNCRVRMWNGRRRIFRQTRLKRRNGKHGMWDRCGG